MNNAHGDNIEQASVGSFFNPVNAAKISASFPGAWSYSKGVRIFPGMGGHMSDAIGGGKKLGQILVGAKQFAKQGNYLQSAKLVGHGIFGGGSFRLGAGPIARGHAVQGIEAELADVFEAKLMRLGKFKGKEKAARATSKTLSKRFLSQHKTAGFASMNVGELAEEILDPSAWKYTFDARKAEGFKLLTGSKAKSLDKIDDLGSITLKNMIMGKHGAKVDILSHTDDLLKKFNITNIGGTKALGGAAKLGIGAGRALTMISLATMGAELFIMAGEQMGNAMIDAGNVAASSFAQRFSPEVGGRLNAGFLSYGAATERQRAIDGMSKAYINGRSAFGEEANFMHS